MPFIRFLKPTVAETERAMDIPVGRGLLAVFVSETDFCFCFFPSPISLSSLSGWVNIITKTKRGIVREQACHVTFSCSGDPTAEDFG